MRIDALTLEGFRNYRRAALDFDPSCNVIYGENAQGKTNLLEAIVYLSCGKSPRARTDRELLGFESERAQLVGHIFSRERAFETEITLARGRRRKMTVNGVPAKNGAALSDVLHTVFFSPEDLFLIRDGAAARRRFMDLSLASCGRGTRRRSRSTPACTSTRRGSCATARSIRSCSRRCRTSTRGSAR